MDQVAEWTVGPQSHDQMGVSAEALYEGVDDQVGAERDQLEHQSNQNKLIPRTFHIVAVSKTKTVLVLQGHPSI